MNLVTCFYFYDNNIKSCDGLKNTLLPPKLCPITLTYSPAPDGDVADNEPEPVK